METLPEIAKQPGQMDLRELYAARHNAFLQIDIDTLADISATAKARAQSITHGDPELGSYQALAVGCDTEIAALYEGELYGQGS